MVYPLKFFMLNLNIFLTIYYLFGWGYWDLNPDRRVTSKVIAPVIHHHIRWPSFNHTLTGARNDAGLHHTPMINLFLIFLFSSSSFFTSHTFLSPFPTHFMSFFPCSWTTFHVMFSSYVIACPKQIRVYNYLGKIMNYVFLSRVLLNRKIIK